MHEKSNFVDILEPRRTQSGIFRFMTRDWHSKKTQILSKKYSPQDLKDITARSVYLENVIDAESAKTGVSKEKLKQEILEYIEEIGLDKKMYVIRWLGMFALKVAFNMNVRIYVNEPAILKIKSAMGKNPVLFLPTHRSYADFCILTYLCYHYDIEFPAVASGMDFYWMAVMGRMLRATCAFYMRRSLAGAPLYAAALRQYVHTLLTKYDAPVEFFLEGTRSRSNKTLPPKFGMLSMALAPLLAGELRDVTLVPVHIAYDRVPEQATFAYHHLGVPKPKESTTGLLKWVSSLNAEFGNMYIKFGEPLSARRLLPAPAAPAAPPDQLAQVRSIAEKVVSEQQRAALLTTTHLVAIVLMRCFMLPPHAAPTKDQLLDSLRHYKRVLRALGAEVWEGGGGGGEGEDEEEGELQRVLRVHADSWRFDGHQRLRLLLPAPRVPHVPHTSDEVMSAESVRAAIPLLQLQLYVNPALGHLVPPALLAALAAHHHSRDELSRHYKLLRTMLRHEFFYAEEDEPECFTRALQYCVERGVVGGPGPSAERGECAARTELSWPAWGPLYTLRAAAVTLTQQGSCEHSRAVKLVQRHVVSSSSSSPSSPPRWQMPSYCVSVEVAAHALRGLAAAGALRINKTNDSSSYEVVPAVMRQCHSLLERVAPPPPPPPAMLTAPHPLLMERPAKSRL